MNYCTLEEAWGTLNKNNITEGYENYKNIEYPNKEIYNSYNENIYDKNIEKIDNNSHRFEFNRGVNKLKNTNGKKNRIRLPKINIESEEINKKRNQENSKKLPKNIKNIIDNVNDFDTYGQINEEEINDNYEQNDNYEEKDSDKSEDTQNKYMINSDYISNKLKYIIQQIDNNNQHNRELYSDSNNINDLLLFIITGLLFIFILDIFVKIGKNLNY